MLPRLEKYLLAIVGLMFVCIDSVFADGISVNNAPSAQLSENGRPVIKNTAGQKVGEYGGTSAAYAIDGNYQGVLLAILPAGYLLPILDRGDVATFSINYFVQDTCKGDAYLPVTLPSGGLQPISGLLFRNLLAKELNYVPKYQAATIINIRSAANFGKNNQVVCTPLAMTLRAFPLKKNDPQITGYAAVNVGGAVAIEMQALAQPTAAVEKPKNRNRLFDRTNSNDSTVSKPDIETELPSECSAGCPADAIGNKSCDTACYVDACSFDGGDCDKEDKKELEKTMAGMCSPGCFAPDVGDGFCDTACNNTACDFDKGDCPTSN